MVLVIDTEYVYKGITLWSPKWRRHNWRTSSGEVDHRDLWEAILWERERAGNDFQLHWVPSHLGVEGNSGADALAETGRTQHPDNQQSLPKRRRVEPMWEELGLEEMSDGGVGTSDSGVDSSSGCCGSSATVSQADDVSESSSHMEDTSPSMGSRAVVGMSGGLGGRHQDSAWMSVTPASVGGGGIIKSISTVPKRLF